MNFPQLRTRTEFSFKEAFGRVSRVADRLAEIGAPAAGIVDGGTWGHAVFEKEAKRAGFRPLFGVERKIEIPGDKFGRRAAAWALAADSREFYRFASATLRPGVDIAAAFAAASGVVRFAGDALDDPECFDYVDVNPESPLQQRRALALAAHTDRPLVLTSDVRYPAPSDFPGFRVTIGQERTTPQHVMTLPELRAALPALDDRTFEQAVANTIEAAERCTSTLARAPMISVPGDLRALVADGIRYRVEAGHVREWSEVYQARIDRELEMIEAKKFSSYFLIVADLVQWAKGKMLVGPGRGSSAGSLVCYCLRITEVDPIVHGLLFERFIDVTRNDLPDVDIDFSDARRDMVFDYLAQKYGRERVARIGSINTFRPRSTLAKVAAELGISDHARFEVADALIEYLPGDPRLGHVLEDTLTQTEAGKKFREKHPEADVLFEIEGHASHTGVHAAGVIVCTEPVTDFCTVGPDGIAHVEKKAAEGLGLLKIDALGLRTLGIIEDAGVVDAERLYGLTLDDPEVFAIFNSKRYSGIFQFEGRAQRAIAAQIEIKSFTQIDHITALSRPGPMGGGATDRYIARAAGREPVEFRHPSMAEYLAPTMGVVLYQEQVMRIVHEIGGFDWAEVAAIRRSMSKKTGADEFDRREPDFVKGARRVGLSEADAKGIWREIFMFGAWGMNASHTVSYSIVSYWCAWLKRYFPLEYAAACLRHAKDETNAREMLREMMKEGVDYIAFDVERSGEDWRAVDGQLLGGFVNLVGFGKVKAAKAVAARAAGTLDREKIKSAQVRFADLYPLRNLWIDYFTGTDKIKGKERPKLLEDLPHEGDVLVLVRVVRVVLRDANEPELVERREGRVVSGPTLMLDVEITDDTGAEMRARVYRGDFERIGREASTLLKAGDIIILRGYRWPGTRTIKVFKWACLNRPDAIPQPKKEGSRNETPRATTV